MFDTLKTQPIPFYADSDEDARLYFVLFGEFRGLHSSIGQGAGDVVDTSAIKF